MDGKIDIQFWGLNEKLEEIVLKEAKERIPEYLKDGSYFTEKLARNISQDAKFVLFINEEGKEFRKELLKEIVKSMSDDEKKQMIIEALIKNR